MKKLKKVIALVLCLLFVQAAWLPAAQKVEAGECKKNGLVCSSTTGKCYYYKNDVKQTNCWKTINNKRYYFGKNGAAYAAEKTEGVNYNIVLKKINGKYYGFNNKGQMVKNGLYADNYGKVYYFNAKGTYCPEATKRYRAASKYQAYASRIRSLMGKAKKTKYYDSCYQLDGKDVVLTYNYVTLNLFRDNASKKEIVLGIYPR